MPTSDRAQGLKLYELARRSASPPFIVRMDSVFLVPLGLMETPPACRPHNVRDCVYLDFSALRDHSPLRSALAEMQPSSVLWALGSQVLCKQDTILVHSPSKLISCQSFLLYVLVGSAFNGSTNYAERVCEPGYFCVEGVRTPCAAGTYGSLYGEVRIMSEQLETTY